MELKLGDLVRLKPEYYPDYAECIHHYAGIMLPPNNLGTVMKIQDNAIFVDWKPYGTYPTGYACQPDWLEIVKI